MGHNSTYLPRHACNSTHLSRYILVISPLTFLAVFEHHVRDLKHLEGEGHVLVGSHCLEETREERGASNLVCVCVGGGGGGEGIQYEGREMDGGRWTESE